MKKMNILLVCLGFVFCVNAQIQDPVQWSFTSKKKGANVYEVHLSAAIANGWHLYSQSTPAGGPVPTAIAFSKNPLLTITGQPKEVGQLQQHHDATFGVDVKQYSGKVDFVQLVKIKGGVITNASGTISFMVCNDHECLPPKTVSFSIPLK